MNAIRSTMLALALVTLFPLSARAETLFTAQDEVLKGLEFTYRLRLNDARAVFGNITAAYPSSPAGPFFTAAIGMGMAESEIRWRNLAALYSTTRPRTRPLADAAGVEANLESVIALCDGMLDRSANDFEALFYKAGAHAFLARLHIFKGDYFKAFSHGKKSVALFDRLYEAYPARGDTMIGPGVYKYYVGRLPTPMRWLVFVLGLSGTKEEGLALAEKAYASAVLSRPEAADFLSRTYGNLEQDGAKALEWAAALERIAPASAAADLNRVAAYRLLRDRKNEEASLLRLYGKLADVDGEVRQRWEPLLDFALGSLREKRGDRAGAKKSYEKALAAPGLDPWLKGEVELKLKRTKGQA